MNWFKKKLANIRATRDPDFVIGSPDEPYLLRWYLIPRNPILNIYLHRFLRSDDDRALHDHPWMNVSYLVSGSYVEHTITQGGIERKDLISEGDWRFRFSGRFAHRVELADGPCTTLFMTGPRYRDWGFHCRYAGRVHWKDFTKAGAAGEIGRGCEQ